MKYFVDSKAGTEALAAVERGSRGVAIFSDLGNGKTAALEALKVKAYDAGYEVYSVVANGETLIEELEMAFKTLCKAIIIVEHYADWQNAVAFICAHAPNHIALVVTSRTSSHDLMVDRLVEKLKPGRLEEIQADVMGVPELEQVAALFDDYGLWGDLASQSHGHKIAHLRNRCRSEWQAILIDRFKAPQIRDRFQAIVRPLAGRKRYFEVVLTILVLNVLEFTPSMDMLLSLCGSAVQEADFRRDALVREVIDVSSDTITFRSSVAGHFILTEFGDPNDIVEVLIKMANASERARQNSTPHFELLKRLMRFNSLQYLFPDSNRKQALIRYYESIKRLALAKRNPLFWLQYAIACTVFEEFERAAKYFDTAYSLAREQSGFNTFQIDNHFARFILLRAIRSQDQATCMKIFRDARKIISEQIQQERMHYPFRVAAAISDFYDAFASGLTPLERQEIGRAAKYIDGRIDMLPEWRRGQSSIEKCKTAMGRVIELTHAS